jgi:adenosylmethionine-8-amino-7-oxononanoate aminotransferase
MFEARMEPVMNLIQRDRAVLWHPYSSIDNGLPLWEVEGADGVQLHLRDELGGQHDVIDAMSSWWCMIHGYRNPVLDDAIRTQLAAFSHVMFGGLTHAPAVELAERLVSLTPEGLRHVFFADSGSVAVEVALKLAVQFQNASGRPRGQRLLSFRGGYHGDTFAAMGISDPVDGMHSTFTGLLASNVFAPRPPAAATATSEDIDRWADEVTALITRFGSELAAIVIEPVLQGAGGMFFYPPECLTRLRAMADEHGLLLIFDEIATGFGRTGALFAADHAGVVPDIMCVGKALTGGYLSLAAAICTSEVARAISRGQVGALLHGPTFMANPLACAVSLASLTLLDSAPWNTRVARIGSELAAGLESARELPGVQDVRTLGAVGVIQLHDRVDVAAVTRVAIREGVWVRPFRDLVYTMPPFTSSTADVARITSAMTMAVAEVHDLAPQGAR